LTDMHGYSCQDITYPTRYWTGLDIATDGVGHWVTVWESTRGIYKTYENGTLHQNLLTEYRGKDIRYNVLTENGATVQSTLAGRLDNTYYPTSAKDGTYDEVPAIGYSKGNWIVAWRRTDGQRLISPGMFGDPHSRIMYAMGQISNNDIEFASANNLTTNDDIYNVWDPNRRLAFRFCHQPSIANDSNGNWLISYDMKIYDKGRITGDDGKYMWPFQNLINNKSTYFYFSAYATSKNNGATWNNSPDNVIYTYYNPTENEKRESTVACDRSNNYLMLWGAADKMGADYFQGQGDFDIQGAMTENIAHIKDGSTPPPTPTPATPTPTPQPTPTPTVVDNSDDPANPHDYTQARKPAMSKTYR
jgi:hypothetical protein